jgi:hypothetical protein
MKKLIIVICILFSLTSFAQKKDSIKYDTAFIFSMKDVEVIKSILMESNININGKPATGKELQQIFQWIDSRGQLFKKEQPKK